MFELRYKSLSQQIVKSRHLIRRYYFLCFHHDYRHWFGFSLLRCKILLLGPRIPVFFQVWTWRQTRSLTPTNFQTQHHRWSEWQSSCWWTGQDRCLSCFYPLWSRQTQIARRFWAYLSLEFQLLYLWLAPRRSCGLLMYSMCSKYLLCLLLQWIWERCFEYSSALVEDVVCLLLPLLLSTFEGLSIKLFNFPITCVHGRRNSQAHTIAVWRKNLD